MSAAADVLVVGPRPRADLLPPEIRAEHTHRKLRRRLLLGLLATVLVVIIGTGGATALSIMSGIQLATAQGRTAELLAEQGKYSEVREVQDDLALVEAGQRVGASTEIDWQKYLTAVQATLPTDVTISSVEIESASVLTDFTQPSVPLQYQRVATLTFTAISPTLPDLKVWLDGLKTLTGYTDGTPTTSQLQDNGTYEVEVTMHIDEDAWSKRFVPEDETRDPEKSGDDSTNASGEEG